MKRKVKKFSHWFTPITPKVYYDKSYFLWHACFEPSCGYFIDGPDQYDINKLVGVSNSILPRVNSLRVGWRYNKRTAKIDVGVYREVNYKKEWHYMASFDFNEYFPIDMFLNPDQTATIMIGNKATVNVEFDHNRLLFGLNPYFGGTSVAPHSMTLHLKQMI